jgi:tuftelin-interacting protein 11
MARRKRQFLEDSDSDSGDSDGDNDGFDELDPDARAERDLFANPYQNKRKGRGGRDDALYGVFASDDEDKGPRGKPQKRSDWTKAPAFVSGDKVEPSKEVNESIEDDGEVEEAMKGDDGDSDDAMDTSGSEASRPASPRVRMEEDEEEEESMPPPRIGGIGFGAAKTMTMDTDGDAPPPRKAGGIGFGKATNYSTLDTPADTPPPTSSAEDAPTSLTDESPDLPSAFGGRARAQRAFVREEAPAPRQKVKLSATETVHFSKLQGSFGARLMAKMGWEAGTGLGSTAEGIVTPIESKLRPNRAGIAFRGFREKTEQSKAEARRKGEVVSDDEDDTGARTKKGKAAPSAKREDAWKRPKKAKTKVEHKTYEQIVAEAGEEASGYSGVGQIIDATGATVSSTSWVA